MAEEARDRPEAGETLDRLIQERVLGLTAEKGTPPYSTDWDAAAVVRARCAAHSMTRRAGKYVARVAVRRERFTRIAEASGETPAVALCHAALASVERAEQARREAERGDTRR